MRLAIDLTDEQRKRLEAIAERLAVPVERLAEAAVRDLISNADSDFESVARRLVEKNRELYERLA